MTARPLRVVPADAAEVDPEAAEEAARAELARARAELPVLDDTVYDCYLGHLTRQLEPTSEADPIAILASLICAAGVHLGQQPHVRAGDDPHPLLVWPLIIGRTGMGRKGASWSTARRLVAAADDTFHHERIKSGLSSGEGLAARFTTDESAETTDGQTQDLRLLVQEPEWGGVMAKMRREGNSLSAILRAAWEGGDLSTLTVNARLAPSSHVGILAHITPREFRDKLSASDMAGGTYNRFLPLAVCQSKFLPHSTGADPDLLASLGTQLVARLDSGAALSTLAFTGPAAQLWRALYVEFGTAQDTHPQVEQFTSRAVPNCLRIAAIHAALDGAATIHPAHLRAAAALVRYSTATARALFTDTTTPTKLAAWITEAGEHGRTREQVRSEYFGRNKPAREITALLDQLSEAGRITRITRPRADGKPGRGTEVFTGTSPPPERG